MDSFVSTGVALVAVATLCAGISRLEPDHRDVTFNICYFVVANVTLIPFSVVAYALSGSLIARAGGGFVSLPTQGAAIVLSVAAFMLLNDFLEFVFHVAQHKSPLLWRFHSLHHSEETINATTALRNHWVDGLVRVIVIYTILGIVFDAASPIVAVARKIFAINHIFCHMNLPASWGLVWWVINSPQYHRCHHSFLPQHIDRNFADLLPVWDVMFGTSHKPSVGEYPATGLQPPVRPTLIGAITWPLSFGTTHL